MKVKIKIGDETIDLTPPGNGVTAIEIPGRPCPLCREATLIVSGRGHIVHEGARFAVAVSRCCRERVGDLKVEHETLFGHEEDERVLMGRCRVY
jgi:hypothetical protein